QNALPPTFIRLLRRAAMRSAGCPVEHARRGAQRRLHTQQRSEIAVAWLTETEWRLQESAGGPREVWVRMIVGRRTLLTLAVLTTIAVSAGAASPRADGGGAPPALAANRQGAW